MSSKSSNRFTGGTKQKNILVAKKQNVNLAQPPLPGKAGGNTSLRDSPSNVLGLKRKLDGAAHQNVKANKKTSAFWNITDVFDKNNKDSKKSQVIENVTVQKKSKRTRSSSTRSLSQVLKPAPAKQVPIAKKNTSEKGTTIIHVVAPITEESISFCYALPSSQDIISSSSVSNKLNFDDISHCKTSCEVSLVVMKVTDVPSVPEGVTDFDKETENDPFAVSEYAEDIFQHYKNRETIFQISKYLHHQPNISISMRAILVDWMVEIQQSFELNHETLYLAVKVVDLYLSKTVISRDLLQLVGSVAIFIACKYDEIMLPCIDDFLYICDDAFNRKELISMEIKILKTIGFELGIPLSYKFLRRYARCGKVCMQDLTLARYILELSLMNYEVIDASGSMLAAAALLLAKSIKGDATWSQTLVYYSGYKSTDIHQLVYQLHKMLCQPPKDHLKNIRNKYSHKVYFGVAKITVPEKLDI